MEAEEIIPNVWEGTDTPNIRGELREIVEKHEINDRLCSEGVICINGAESGILIKIEGRRMDFNKGREILDLSIESARHRIDMEVESIFVSNEMIDFTGVHDSEGYQLFP